MRIERFEDIETWKLAWWQVTGKVNEKKEALKGSPR
jgi:hypothetical protein